MKIKVYVDTNIYVYAIIHHPTFGNLCENVLIDIGRRLYEFHGSLLVAMELLGSLSKIDPYIAKKALEDYFALPLTLLSLNEEVLRFASIINEVANIRYDAVHAAVMLLNGISTIVTNDVDDWNCLKSHFNYVLARVKREGYDLSVNEIEVVTPDSYEKWKKGQL